MSDNYTGVRVAEVGPDLVNLAYTTKRIPLASLDGRITRHLAQNEYVVLKFENPPNSQSALTRVIGEELVLLPSELSASGIKPRNKEQRMAMDALLDDRIKVVVLTGRAGTGKAQPLDAKVLTPMGWTRMGNIIPGDNVLTPKGEVVSVQSIHPQGVIDIYKVTFSDGSSTECCLDHLWLTQTQKDRDSHREGTVKSLVEIKETLRYGKAQKRNHSIPMVESIGFYGMELPLDPYLIGALIGDGCIKFSHISLSNTDQEILSRCREALAKIGCRFSDKKNVCDYNITNVLSRWNKPNIVVEKLKELGLHGHGSKTKFIPETYKFAKLTERIALLQGLLDTDGTIDKRTGNISYSTISTRLASDLKELVQSLGGKARIADKQTYYMYKGEKKAGQPSFVISLSLPNTIQPFSTSKKQELVVQKTKYPPRRYIDSIELVGKKEAQCIYLNNTEHLYVTNEYIVTHNTLLTLAAAMQKFEEEKYSRLVLTRPMSWVGEHGLGALPGEVSDKFGPYLQNYMCNIECLLGGKYKSIPDIIAQFRIDFIPIQLIRGASWANTFIIADEVQVLGYDEMVALGTRVGEGSKIVIMGDLGQRDENIAKEKTGIWKFVNDTRSKDSQLVASIDLIKCERSEIAALFADVFER